MFGVEPFPAELLHERLSILADGKAVHEVSDIFKPHRMTAHAAGQSLAKPVMGCGLLASAQVRRESDLMRPASVYSCRSEFALAV